MVGLLGGYEQHVQTGLVGRKLLGHLPRGLDHPEVEVLGLYHEVVAIRNLLLDLFYLLAGEPRHDTVHQCGIDAAGLLEPFLEVGTEVPQVDILIDALLQHMTVQEDQFTGEDDQSLGHVTAERLVTAVKQLHQFAGITAGGRIL